MSAALVCLAVAVLVLPPPTSRGRFSHLFTPRVEIRKLSHRKIIRLSMPAVVSAALLCGPGTFLALSMAAATGVLRLRRAAAHRRRDAERANLLEALEAVIGELRVGAHPSAAAELAARESKGEAARAFAVGAARSRLGGSAAEGLRRSDSPVAAELGRIADAWQVAEQHGLALAELLSSARTDLTGRMRFHSRTAAALAGARATASVLAGLPGLGIALGQMMGASPVHVLFASPAGAVLLPLGTALACAGLLWTDVITRKVLL